MSELNLTLFMMIGYAQAHWLVVAVFVLGVLVLNYLAWAQPGAFFNKQSVRLTGKLTMGVFAVLFLTIPTMTGSSLAMMGYWLDWVLLLVMSLGYSIAISFWLYPIVRIYQGLQARAVAK